MRISIVLGRYEDTQPPGRFLAGLAFFNLLALRWKVPVLQNSLDGSHRKMKDASRRNKVYIIFIEYTFNEFRCVCV